MFDVDDIPVLEIFYDSRCDLCSRLADMVYDRDVNQDIVFSDLEDNAQILRSIYRIDPDEARRKIHGIDGIGTIYSGFDLVLKVAELLEYKRFSRLFSLPVFKQVAAGCFWTLSKLRKIL